MKILAISDLHICADKSFDKFQWVDSEFIKKIERYRSLYKIDFVVIAGDIYEMYFFDEKEIKEKNAYLYSFIENTPWIVCLKGNHDRLTGNDDKVVFDKVYFEHGHKGDIYGIPIVNVIVDSLHKVLDFFNRHIPILKKIYISKYRKYMEDYEGEGAKDSLRVLKRALKLLEKYDMIVMGHTHIQQTLNFNFKSNKKIYVNTGTCSNHRFEGAIIDTETLSVELIKE